MMTKRKRLTHKETEALISGRSTAHPEITEALETLGSGWSDLSEDRGRRQLTAIHEAAASHAHENGPATSASRLASATGTTRRRMLLDRSKTLALRLSSSVVALSAATMGLAHAGVDLPGTAAERAFSAVGIELPNQENNGKSVAEDVKEAIESTDPGCERGRAVSAAASQNRQNEAKEKADPCAKDEKDGESSAQGSKSTGEEKSAAGKAKAEQKKAKAEERKAAAEEKREEAGKPETVGPSGTGRPTERPQQSESGKNKGQTNSQGKGNSKGRLDRVGEMVTEMSIGTSN